MKEDSTSLAAWIQAAVHTHAVQLLDTAAVELHHLEARRDVPDVHEGDVSKVAAPLHGDADAAEEGLDGVAEVLAAVEASVGVAPHAVHGPDSFRLCQDIFESDLQVIVDVVRVTINQVQFGHSDVLGLMKTAKNKL